MLLSEILGVAGRVPVVGGAVGVPRAMWKHGGVLARTAVLETPGRARLGGNTESPVWGEGPNHAGGPPEGFRGRRRREEPQGPETRILRGKTQGSLDRRDNQCRREARTPNSIEKEDPWRHSQERKNPWDFPNPGHS